MLCPAFCASQYRAAAMYSVVFGSCNNHKILYSVIGFIHIDMMNNFVFPKFPT